MSCAISSPVLDVTPACDGLALQAVVNAAPRAQYDPAKQKHNLDNAVKRRREYVGALIVPVAPSESKRDLADFVQRFGQPVIFLDTNPCLQPEEYTPRSCFIGVNDRAGGELAAAAMLHELKKLEIARPRILVFPGGFHEAREQSFEQVLRRERRDAVLVIADTSYFDRDKARRTARAFLAAAADQGLRYDGAFCTGDEMALGLLDAVAEKRAGTSERLVVIGYDGINEARRLIDRRDSPFKNTVVQDTRELGETAILQLASMLEKQRAPDSSPEIWLMPHLYHGLVDAL